MEGLKEFVNRILIEVKEKLAEYGIEAIRVGDWLVDIQEWKKIEVWINDKGDSLDVTIQDSEMTEAEKEVVKSVLGIV